DQAFDVVRALLELENAIGFKNNDFPALRAPEVICDAIHKETIPARHFELHDVLTFFVMQLDGHALVKQPLRRKPNRIWAVANSEALPLHKRENHARLFIAGDETELSIVFRDDVIITDPPYQRIEDAPGQA